MFAKLGGTLLILGEPGAGKTTALLELASALLDQAEVDECQPIPVVVNLASWPRRRSSLAAWLVDELYTGYQVPKKVGQTWLNAGELLPLLDGLDEVRIEDRSACAAAISAFYRAQGLVRLAVCCRTAEYQALGVRLGVDEAVELQAPTRQQVYDYLDEAGAPLADVRAALEDASDELWTFLRSPLVLSIVTLAYRDRSADALRGRGSLAKRRDQVFSAYTERMLERRPTAVRWPAERMLRWLVWLARSMHERSLSEFHLDRLSLDWLPTKAQQRFVRVSVGLACSLPIVALTIGRTRGGPVELAVGLAFGLALGLICGAGLPEIEPVEKIGWSWANTRRRMLVTLIAGLWGVLLAALSGLPEVLHVTLGQPG